MDAKDRQRRIQDEEDADDERLLNFIIYMERSTLIILGLTVTALAGFLSQVWGTAGVPFRTELAELLKRSGEAFTLGFTLPVVRYATKDGRGVGWVRTIALIVLWGGVSFVVYVRLILIFHDAAATILKYAKIP